MRFRGKASLSNLVPESLQGVRGCRSNIRVHLREPGCEVGEKAEQVVDHQHLPVTIGTRTDADGYYTIEDLPKSTVRIEATKGRLSTSFSVDVTGGVPYLHVAIRAHPRRRDLLPRAGT